MRKLLCVLLSAIVLLSGIYCPSVRAEVNYSADFEDAINMLRWHSPYWDIAQGESFPVASIINYTKQRLCCDAYGEEPITEGDYTYYARYAIPADVFEAAAMDFFAIVDINALRSYTSFFWDHVNFTGIDNFQNYQEDRGVYLFSNNGGIGDPSWYEVLGYTQENGKYTVYSRMVSLLWGKPEGVEGEDFIVIDGEYFEIEHYLETVVSISNGRVQFHSWDEMSSKPDVELTPPLTLVAESETVSISAAEGVFPADVTIEIDMPAEETMQTVDQSLAEIAADFVAYEITASAQPNGTAQVTFAIPEGFDPEKLALFHISDDGVVQRLDVVINVHNGTMTAELPHFSVYAVAELIQRDPPAGDANGDGKVNTRDARLILRYIAELMDADEIHLTAADYDRDGNVSVRDARAILRDLAMEEE